MNEYAVEYKSYFVKPSKLSPSVYEVVTSGQGGKIPDCLKGMFTSRTLAKTEIDLYLEQKLSKGKKNEEDSTSRSQ